MNPTAQLTRRVMLSTLASAPAIALATPSIANPHPDAELLALARQLEAYDAEYNRRADLLPARPEEFDTLRRSDDGLGEMDNQVMAAIITTPATTLDGLRVKAWLVARYHTLSRADDPDDGEDARALNSLLRDLIGERGLALPAPAARLAA